MQSDLTTTACKRTTNFTPHFCSLIERNAGIQYIVRLRVHTETTTISINTDRCRTQLVKATSISSFCWTSMVHVLTISHDRDQDIMLKQWIWSQIWLDISLKWSDIQHNWSEIVTGTSSPDLLSWTVGGNVWANGLH